MIAMVRGKTLLGLCYEQVFIAGGWEDAVSQAVEDVRDEKSEHHGCEITEVSLVGWAKGETA